MKPPYIRKVRRKAAVKAIIEALFACLGFALTIVFFGGLAAAYFVGLLVWPVIMACAVAYVFYCWARAKHGVD